MSLLGNQRAKKHSSVDYHEKKLENPFYKRQERIISFAGIQGKLTAIAIGLVLFFILWFIFISNFWQIQKISISGLDQLSNDDVNNLVSQQMHSNNYIILPQGNLLFFNEQKFQDTLHKKYHFQKTVIKKDWPHSLSINIINKPIICIWNEDGKYYYTDTDGYAVQEINPLNLTDNKYPLIANQSSFKMFNGRITVDPDYLNFISSLYDKLNKLSLGISIDRFIINDSAETITVLTPQGLKIMFNTKDDIDKQLGNLSILKNQKLKDDFNKQKSIDLRFGDKIYYQ
jgi:cell division septal protein FtsQ